MFVRPILSRSPPTRLDHLLRVCPSFGVDGETGDGQKILRQHGRALVDGLAAPVERAPHQVVGNGHLQDRAREFDMRVLRVDTGRAFEDLGRYNNIGDAPGTLILV